MFEALLSATRGGTYLVPTNGNACEKFVGYYTKGGDNVGDISPIGELTVEEVYSVYKEKKSLLSGRKK